MFDSFFFLSGNVGELRWFLADSWRFPLVHHRPVEQLLSGPAPLGLPSCPRQGRTWACERWRSWSHRWNPWTVGASTVNHKKSEAHSWMHLVFGCVWMFFYHFPFHWRIVRACRISLRFSHALGDHGFWVRLNSTCSVHISSITVVESLCIDAEWWFSQKHTVAPKATKTICQSPLLSLMLC